MVVELLLCGEYHKGGFNTFLVPTLVVRLLEVLFEGIVVSVVDVREVILTNLAGLVLERLKVVVELFYIVVVFGTKFTSGVE